MKICVHVRISNSIVAELRSDGKVLQIRNSGLELISRCKFRQMTTRLTVSTHSNSEDNVEFSAAQRNEESYKCANSKNPVRTKTLCVQLALFEVD